MTRGHAMRSSSAALARRHAAQRGRTGRGDVGLAARVETRTEGVRRVPEGRAARLRLRADQVGAREPQPRALQRRLAAPPPSVDGDVQGARRERRRGAGLAPEARRRRVRGVPSCARPLGRGRRADGHHANSS